MPYNGSGVFQRLYTWVNDAASNIKIRADRMDNEMNGFATGLSQAITKDGQTTVTANLPMATYRHTNVGNAVNRNEYATFGQVLDGKGSWAASVGGTADVITVSFSPVFSAYATGMEVSFVATGANTGAVTLNVDSLGAKAVTKNGTTALVAGDIPSGAIVTMRYDGTRFQLLNVSIIGLTDGDKGDITVSSNGTSWQIDAGAVGSTEIATNAVANTNLAQMATQTFKGRTTAGTGNVEDLTVTQATAMLNTFTSSLKGLTPASGGSALDYLKGDTTFGKPYNLIANQAATSGTAVDFTGIPSGVSRIRIYLYVVSTNGTGVPLIQIGNGAIVTGGYVASAQSGTSATSYTTGFGISNAAAATDTFSGVILLDRWVGNGWVLSGTVFRNSTNVSVLSGILDLAGVLDRLRLTSGGSTFDGGGQIAISYE